jgi:hypothetical protein
MNANPYASPAANASAPDTNTGGTASIHHRAFGGRAISFALTQESYRDDVRHEAQEFINSQVGADNVVSIVEHAGSFQAFSVVVWFRVRE